MITLVLYLVATVATAFAVRRLYFFICRFFTGAGHRRRVRRDQLRDRRADPGARARPGRPDHQRLLLARRRRGALRSCSCSTPASSRPTSAGASRSGIGAVLGLGDPARPPPRAREPALAVHPRPRGGGRADRRRDRARGRARRPAAARGARRTRSRSASASRSRSARSPRPPSSATRARRSSASRCSSARRSSTTRVTFDLGTFLSTFFDIESGRVPVFIALFAVGELPRAAAARAAVRHGRPQADDRRHLPRLGGRAGRARRSCSIGGTLGKWGVHGAAASRRSSSPRPARARPT